MNDPNRDFIQSTESLKENILDLARILHNIRFLSGYHTEELKLMRATCGFQDEIESGSSKLFSTGLNQKHSSKF
jgi:hypothetical protein